MLASGIRPTIFDIKSEVGGLWSTSSAFGIAGLNMEMTTNLSYFSCSLSDLAWPEGSSLFPAAKEVGIYLKDYQKKYIPNEMMKLGCGVTSIRGEEGGRWRVEWRGGKKSVGEGAEVFDFLAVCSGFFSTPYIPPIEGMGSFGGRVLHSMEYALSKFELEGKKRIVVAGGSISGAEVAADLALRVSSLPEGDAEKVEIIHLIQRPFWILPKYFPVSNSGDVTAPRFLPNDFVLHDFNKRLEQANQPPTSPEEGNMAANCYLKTIIGHDQHDISPALQVSDEYMQQSPWIAITDSYASFVRTGVIKPMIGRISGVPSTSPKTLILGPGSAANEIGEVDTIVLATGYHPTSSLQSMFTQSMFSSFTSSPSVPKDPNFLPFLLYNQTLHPAFQRTGGFVGMHKGPYFGVMEMQGRWLAGLFSGKLNWPTDEEMQKGIEASGKIRDSRADSNQSTFRPQWSSGDYLGVVDDLRRRLNMPLTPSATVYSPNPMIPAHFIDTDSNRNEANNEANDEANRMLGSLKAYIAPPSATKITLFVARAIFRSLQGKWALSRRINSKHPGFPSGQFTGSAEFRPRAPTFVPSPRSEEESDPPGCATRLVQDHNPPSFETPGGEVLEYLYVEQGNFTTDTGSTMTGHRRYIYRYHPSEDVITVWFVKADGIEVDYFFHEVSILGASQQESETSDSVGEVDLKGGWKASGKHLCRLDWYWPSYRFVFKRDLADLEKFWIRYKVSGPQKDYTAEGGYQRA